MAITLLSCLLLASVLSPVTVPDGAPGRASAGPLVERTSLPLGLVLPPLVESPWTRVPLRDPPRRPIVLAPAKDLDYPICERLPASTTRDEVLSAGRSVPAGAVFPALEATPPKLWGTERCAGEGMR